MRKQRTANTGFAIAGVPGNATFLASDSGYYTVLVSDALGCSGSDTIRVSYFPAPTLDTTNLNIAPTTCGGTTGAVTGLQIIGQSPFTYQWTAYGTPISSAADIYNLGVGLYELSVTDGFGCTTKAASYVIHDPRSRFPTVPNCCNWYSVRSCPAMHCCNGISVRQRATLQVQVEMRCP